jgi:LPS-assembly lipoprotein
MKLFIALLVVVLMSLLASCGYHLRGAYQLPPQMATTVIRSDNMNGELVRSLRRGLETGGTNVVSEVNPADSHSVKQSKVTVLRLFKENQSKRVLSVDVNGRVREFELYYKISIELTGADGFFMPEQTLELSRDFLFDPEDVLGKSDEEADLLRDMQRDMVRLIMLRLQAVAQKKNLPDESLPVQ